jgi:phosphatidylinositol N-acetylglucosaminyltransferase subunit A
MGKVLDSENLISCLDIDRNSDTGSRRQYRIAMVCDFFFPRLGGVENHIWSLSQHLLRLGHKVIVVTHGYDPTRKSVRYMTGGLKVYYCPILPMVDQTTLPSFTATLPLMRHIMIRERINIVHAHQATSTMANECIVYASMMGIPSVYTDHSLFAFNDLASVILNRVLRTTLCTVDGAIAVSRVCRSNLILRAHLDPSHVRVIPNAVDTSKFTPDPSRRCKDRYASVKDVMFLFIRDRITIRYPYIHFLCHPLESRLFLFLG